ncbi:MAG: dienelactone hydrolase family protein [Bacteroidota bacterium]|nr:dienelactone hydrolase family protein [Bacteroidota bacterium]
MMRELHIVSKEIAPHNSSKILMDGVELDKAKAVMIMIHGRGATAESILDIAQYFIVDAVTYIAPQANGGTWYPYSFLMPTEQNEPGITSGLQRISEIVDHVVTSGIPEQKIMLLGFSQGACLSLEWTARSNKKIGAVFGLSGGLIGPNATLRNYSGTLENTSVFLGCSDVDFHIPKERVIESADIFKKLNASVTITLYPNMAHTVNDDEIDQVNSIMRDVAKK